MVPSVCAHDTEARSLLPRNLQNGDGRVSLVLLVEVHHLGVVHLVDVVAGQDNDIFRVVAVDEAYVLVDRVCCAGVPRLACRGFIGRQYMHAAVGAVESPGLTIAYVFIQHQRLILRQHAYCVDPGIYAVGEREVDYPVLSSVGDCRASPSPGSVHTVCFPDHRQGALLRTLF